MGTTSSRSTDQLWPCRASATGRVPDSLVGRFCALVWPAREAARPVTIVFGYLSISGVDIRSGGTRTLQTQRQMQEVLRRELLHSMRVRETTIMQQTSMLPACYMQVGCNRPRTSPELPQWNPLASLVTLHTVNFLANSYAARSSPSGSLVPSAPSHI